MSALRVTCYGRWLYLVESESRPWLRHLVDLEPELDNQGNIQKGGQLWQCSCEAHFYHVTRPCKHLRAVLAYIRPVLEHLASFPQLASSFETKMLEKEPK